MRVKLLMIAGCLLAAAMPVQGLSISFCSAQIECICLDWNNGQEVRCPSPGATELGGDPRPTPHADPNAGPRGPSGSHPGRLIEPRIRAKLNQAKSRASARGNLAGLLPLKHDEYEPTTCMDMFRAAEPGFTNGRWVINQFTRYRDGAGVGYAGRTPCSEGVAAWTARRTRGHDAYPYVFICPNAFEGLSTREQAVRLIHEALHTAFMPESLNGGSGGPAPNEIDAYVRSQCPGL